MNHLTSPQFRRLALLAVLVPLAAAGPVSSTASGAAGAASPPTVELLSRGAVAEPFDAESHGIEVEANRRIDVAVAHLTFDPGDTTGWHRHPGPTVVTVKTGEITIIDRKCQSHTFEAGDAFVEEGPRRHNAVNAGDVATEVYVTFLVPRGAAAFLIPAATPDCAD